jgi:hypothetical protein
VAEGTAAVEATPKRETTELVRDLFEWTAAHPESDRIRRTIESHEQTTRAVQAAEGREAQSRAWTERMYVENAERERELAPVRQRFGGRVRHLVPEYERRGMLARGQEPGRNPSYLEFLLETGMVAELAERLEALSRKL